MVKNATKQRAPLSVCLYVCPIQRTDFSDLPLGPYAVTLLILLRIPKKWNIIDLTVNNTILLDIQQMR